MLVPASRFRRRVPYQFACGNPPLFTLRREVNRPVTKIFSVGRIEWLDDLFPVQQAFGNPMIKSMLTVECHGGIPMRHASELLSAIQQERQLISSVDQIWRLTQAAPSKSPITRSANSSCDRSNVTPYCATSIASCSSSRWQVLCT